MQHGGWSGCETLPGRADLPRPGDVWWPVNSATLKTPEAVRRPLPLGASKTSGTDGPKWPVSPILKVPNVCQQDHG